MAVRVVGFTVFKTRININFLFVAMLSLLSLLDKSGCLFLSFLFSLLHEAGHMAAVAACKGEIREISFYPFGIAMKLRKNCCFSRMQEFFVLFAGCAVNLLCAAIFWFSKPALYINMGIFLFNILPVGCLDGGRILSLFLHGCFSEKEADMIHNAVSFAVLLPLSAAAFYITVRSGQFTLLLCCAYLALTLMRKPDRII